MPKKYQNDAVKQRKTSPQKPRNGGPAVPRSKAFKAGLAAVQNMPSDTPIKSSKQAVIISLLQRPDGASLVEMMQATGWQAHTVRGVISGVVRKKLGLMVLCEQNASSTRVYRIKEAS